MLVDTLRIASGSLDDLILQETCDICTQEFVLGEVAVFARDGGAISNFWHRRCVSEILAASVEDSEIQDRKFEQIASTWGNARG